MSKAFMGVSIGIGAIVLLGLFIFASYVSNYNLGARSEAGLVAARDNSQNILTQYEQKVLEASQVPAMQRDDLKDIFKTAMTARYGEDGSKAVFQFLKEHNPTLDQTTYRQIQQIIEAGRNDFKVSQTYMIDRRKEYQTSLNSFWSGLWLRVAGYPKVDLNLFNPIVTDRTNDVFETGIEKAPLKLR